MSDFPNTVDSLDITSRIRSVSNSESEASLRTSLTWAEFLTTPQKLQKLVADSKTDALSTPSYDHDDSSQVHQENIHDLIFNMFKDNNDEILVGKFLVGLEKAGLKRSDQRLKELFVNLRDLLKEEEMEFRQHPENKAGDYVGSIETIHLNRETFVDLILSNIFIISAAFRNTFVIPKFEAFCAKIDDIYSECKKITSGRNAPYIKHLARMKQDYWGVSICTVDGQRFSIGDTDVPITLHSLSKPLMYAIALNELGKDVVHKYVGQEISGHEYNELVLDYNQRPHNPMINSGGIMIHALLQNLACPKLSNSDRFDQIHESFLKLTGREYIGFNNSVFLEKKNNDNRNWALSHYMMEYKCFPKGTSLNDVMEFYLQTSSLESTCEVLAIAASTLANGGICPVTGERALSGEIVPDVLSVMNSCGMYDYSGQFAFKVGLPAKSSISGLVLLVIPNVCGMALWSPRLDSIKNSARGVAFCEKLVKVFNFHIYDSIASDQNKIDPRRKRLETKASNTINLLYAAGSGDMNSLVRMHLSGIDMGIYDCDGRTALHLASCENHFEIVEYLLRQCGVDHQTMDRWGHTALDEAKQFGCKKIAEFLQYWAQKKSEEKNGREKEK